MRMAGGSGGHEPGLRVTTNLRSLQSFRAPEFMRCRRGHGRGLRRFWRGGGAGGGWAQRMSGVINHMNQLGENRPPVVERRPGADSFVSGMNIQRIATYHRGDVLAPDWR